jgi:hypothetical protein
VMARSSPEDKYLMVTRLNGTSSLPTAPQVPPHFSSHHSPQKPLPCRLASHFRVCVYMFRREPAQGREGVAGEAPGPLVGHREGRPAARILRRTFLSKKNSENTPNSSQRT